MKTEIQNVRKNDRGFSLVELMVVITIIGILAGIAIPKFQTFRARAQQTEAKSGLNAVFLSAQAYEANYGEYPGVPATDYLATVSAIGFAAGGNKQRYVYSFVSGPLRWAANARSAVQLNDGNYDFFRVNTNKWMCQPFDAVTGIPAVAASGKNTATSGNECPVSLTAAQAAAGTQKAALSGCADFPIGSPGSC